MERRRAGLCTWAVVIGAIACWWWWSPPGANDLVGGDEGYYGTMARNVLADARDLVSPSLHPLGPPGDKPPLYPGLLALSIAAFGPTEAAVRWPSLLLAGGIALGVGALVRRAAGAWAGCAAAGVLVLLPWYADAARSAAAEIPLTALGVAALLAVPAGTLAPRRALGAGALLGLAFLCKLWLVALLALPVLAAARPAPGRRVRTLAALATGAVLVGGAHLVAVALLAPADLAHWWRIYVGFSLAGRVGGAGFADYWLRPPGFYWGLMTHAYGPLLPLVLCGAAEAARRVREPWPRALLVWAAGVIVLSAFTVKSGQYAFVVVPAWAALAGLGAAALAARRHPPRWAVALVVLGSFPPLVERTGGVGLGWATWLVPWLAYGIARLLAERGPARAAAVAVALTVASALPGAAREAQRLPLTYHAPGLRGVAAQLAPLLAHVPPGRVCFVAPEAPSLEFYLFRTGTYWSSPYEPWSAARRARVQADTALRAFVVEREPRLYGGALDSTMLRWLEDSTAEITARADERTGRTPALRVFARR